jgi:Mrp family chromosome partitioning ATPase
MRRLPSLPSLRVLATSEPVAPTARFQPMGLIERATRRLPELIRDAGELSDLVILDTAALGEVSDGLRILPCADRVLVVARLRQTKRAALTKCGDLLARAGRTPVGIVLTGEGRKPYQPYETAFSDGRAVPDVATTFASTEGSEHTTAGSR